MGVILGKGGIGLVVAIAGPGSASADNAIGIDVDLDGPVGALLVAGALLAAVGQLAVFFKPESDKDAEAA